ncbi:MAG: ribosome silencing factor [Spirochaetaceae bacterium]|nr:ribosome silencing factor [Spirochaetaceae bacterium]MDE0227394.1 ribosome silencing factor [Spirochaetaceae bacterium]MDE0448214.1 ribosome silencing factor [Spirochaetaceae bacterium]
MCALARLLADHRCENPVILDIAAVSDVADYFVIATVRSSTHLAGVYGYLMQYCKEQGMEPLGGSKRMANNPWLLVDLGPVVVHLMERETREYYELERLWFNGRRVPVRSPAGGGPAE